MADKEATVYIVDLGSTMGKRGSGRDISNLDLSMKYVWDRISTTVAASRKTWTVGVLGLRTDKTDNAQQEEEGYENISVLQPLGPMTMTSLKDLQQHIRPSKTTNGDAISAIVVAIDMIDTFTKKLKYKRRVILVTDGLGAMDADDIDDISTKANESSIELIVIGVDFDDAEYGFKEEEKPKLKKKNEGVLKKLVDQCKDGVFGTMAQAVEELDTPRLKPIRPVRSYDGPLTLGDPETYPDASITINVERWPKTKLARPPGATTVVLKAERGAGPSQSTGTLDGNEMDGVEMTGGDFANIHQVRTYKVADPDAPGGKMDVDFDDLAKGYEYGRTAVHISESEFNITKLETTKSFSIIGFIPIDKYEPFLNIGDTNVIVAKKWDEKSELALSALINALWELDSYAVARLVIKDGKEPQIVILVPNPRLDGDFECLYEATLPFAEDVRAYQFPPLDKVVTVTGSVLTKHRLLPTNDLQKAMNDYVDAMDISKFAKDDEGEPTEYAPPDESFNPVIHRVNQAIRERAIYPEQPVGPVPENLTRFSHPPADLVDQARTQIDALIDVAEVKKVPPKARGKYKREQVKPVSGLDVAALLGQQRPRHNAKISEANSVPEFKQVLASAGDLAVVEDAVKQMGEIVRSLVRNSTGDSGYDRAAENMRVMRAELVNLEEPAMYNAFVRDLKKRLLAGELNGDRRLMWLKVGWERLGLITQDQAEGADVTEKEAEEFLKSR